jgi:hypothetical protein
VKTNFVLIDYENVQPATIDCLNHDFFKILIFIGVNQTKVTVDVAAALQQLGPRATYIKISSHGANALDFHIAFYIGHLAAQEPDAYFHIISKDTGFDPLIQHLKGKKIFANRVHSVTDIPIVKIMRATTRPEQIAVILTAFQQRSGSKPRTVKTLISTINALFLKRLSDADLASLIRELQTRGIIHVDDTNVTYTLPS